MQQLCATAAAAYLLLSISNPVEASTVTSTPRSGMHVASETGAVSFPILPHHVQRRRLGLSDSDVAAMEDELEGLRQRRLQQGRRRSAEDTRTKLMGGLYMGYGTHYADLYCGTPPQRQTVIVDTGSSNTGFPCSDCTQCGADHYHTGPLFDEARSSTFLAFDCDSCSMRSTCNQATDRCEIEQYYSEGSSWTAYEAMDTCYLGGYHNTPILQDDGTSDDVDPGHAVAFGFDTRLGCQTEVTGLFKTQLADGILGMCDSKQAFWHQMFRSHKIREKKFSLCFARPPHALREGSEAGAVTLGGTDERLHDGSPMVYTTLVGTSSEYGDDEPRSGYYDIHVREMYLRDGSAGESVQSSNPGVPVIKLNGAGVINDEGGVIVDSGTTDTYFSTLIKKQLQSNWEKLAGRTWGHDKLNLSKDEIAKLPTLLLQFAGDVEMNAQVANQYGDGDPNQIPGLAGDLDKNFPYDVIVAIPAAHYMEALSDGSVTNRLYATETDGSVLGANALLGHDVMFDAQNMRLGWAESSCDYGALVRENGYTSAMKEVHESAAEIQKEDEEEEAQEDEKEEFDEENAEEEIEEDNEEIEDFVQEGGALVDFDDDAHQGFTKTKHNSSKNIEIPIDDLLDHPEWVGVGAGAFFLCLIFCAVKCCVPAAKNKRRKKRLRKQHQIEMSGTGLDGGYRDNFDDEDGYDDYSDDENSGNQYDDADEYGERVGLRVI